MAGGTKAGSEATRLEGLWAGDFGSTYSARNATAGESRAAFWETLLAKHAARRVLEVGCNVGTNLQWIAPRLPVGATYGIDVNEGAVEELRRRLPGVNAVSGTGRELPFRDGWFDLAFTTGVLIHQAEATLPLVMAEIVRVSRQYVLCGEYYAPETVEVPYRGLEGALFKRNYGKLYAELFPDLEPVDEGFLGKEQGFDDVTWWLFAKP